MEYLLTLLLLFSQNLSQTQLIKPKYTVQDIPKNLSTKEKKKRFLYLVLPSAQSVHDDWMQRYIKIKEDMQKGKNRQTIEALKKHYNATDNENLLARLKPHPVSITLAQAAMESSWATSRFFLEANNIFGMWSTNAKEPRIAAQEQRGGNFTVWLRKFDTIYDSIEAYYELMATAKAYAKFRKLRLETDDPFIITQGLEHYSELGQAYIDEINSVIRHNNFTQYDRKKE